MHQSRQFQGQDMEQNGKPPALSCLSCRRCFFIILIVAGTILFYSQYITDWNDWNPSMWKTYQNIFYNISSTVSVNSARPSGNSTASAPYVSPGPYRVEYPHDYHFTINQPQRCHQLKPFVVVIVPVAPQNREHRDDIRSTWGNQKVAQGKVVTLLFLLGQPSVGNAAEVQQQVLEESGRYGDLLQGDFLDCYKNLTIKTMVMMEWLQTYCPNASYAMKIDSDIFLNVDNLISMLSTARRENYLTGLVAHGAVVLRDKGSKWYLPESVFPEAHYPPYALGLGYVFTLDLPKKILEASRHVPNVYIEDVYVGLCMKHLQIRPTDPPANKFYVFALKYNRCAFSKVIATMTVPGTKVRETWKDYIRPGPRC